MSGVPASTTELLGKEANAIFSARITDFHFLSVDPCVKGTLLYPHGIVILARCKAVGHPFPAKVYALKTLKDYAATTPAAVRARTLLETEFSMLLTNPDSPHIIKCWSYFTDVLPDAVLTHFTSEDRDVILSSYTKAGISPASAKAMYGVFDYHPMTLERYRFGWCVPVLPRSVYGKLARDIVNGELMFERGGILHRDVQLCSVDVKSDGTACFTNFTVAITLPRGEAKLPVWRVLIRRDGQGGNVAHCAPEVLHALAAFVDPRVEEVAVDYSGQGSFETGVLLWELLTGQHPFPGYPYGSGSGMIRVVTSFDDIWACHISAWGPLLMQAGYPSEFIDMFRSMTAANPSERSSLTQIATQLEAMFPATDTEMSYAQLQRTLQLEDEVAQLKAEKAQAKTQADATIKALKAQIEALTAQHAETLAALQSAHGKSVVEQVTMRRERDTVAVEVAVVRSELAVAVSERDMWKTEHRTVTAQLRATNSELQAAQTMIQQLHAEMELLREQMAESTTTPMVMPAVGTVWQQQQQQQQYFRDDLEARLGALRR